MKTMKAIRYHGPHDCRLEECPIPTPADDEVLIEVRATGICATDVEIYEGRMFYFTSGQSRIPLTPGHEWAGEVVDIGRDVRGFAPGDRVCGECSVGCRACSYCLLGWYNLCPNRTETGILNRDGAFAEYIAFPQDFLHVCNDIPFEIACLVEPVGVAVYAVKEAQVSPADHVVVLGAGPIGLLTLQVAKAYGARTVTVVETLGYRREKALELGADAAIDPDNDDLTTRLAQITGGHRADVVLESTGHPSVWSFMPALLAPRARIGIIGLSGGKPVTLDFDPYVIGDVTLRGRVGSPNCWPEAIDLIRRGQVRPDAIVTHQYPLESFDEAIGITRQRLDQAIKVMVVPNTSG